MLNASMTIDPAFRIAPVHRRTFGSFVEHLGRSVYTGIFEPDHPTADPDGFRTDVLDLVRELGVSTVRYPGGNFVSGYRWEDSVGPRAQRPTRLDLAWQAVETNEFGLDEFMRWAHKAGVEPMMAVNLGTRGLAEAVNLLEYCTYPGGTHLSDLRIAHGATDPYHIPIWCLGNEMDGPWQIGHKTALEYGRLAAETGRAMRILRPDLELVACGSSHHGMPTFGAWERTVLEETYDVVDYISLHAYYEEHDGDLPSFLATATDMDAFIDEVVATADSVGARLGHNKRIQLSFDEWNVWYREPERPGATVPAPQPGERWPQAPRQLEDHYHLADAVVVGNLLMSLLRHSDRVTAACQAQLVNVIAPIVTEPGGRAWKQTIFHPFAAMSANAAGDVLRVEPVSPTRHTDRYGAVPVVDAVATVDEESGALALFLVNRAVDEAVRVDTTLRGLDAVEVSSCVSLYATDGDVYATNTADDPERVSLRPNTDVHLTANGLGVELPPVSWTMVTLTVRE
ncbi:alpha-N-arabinofuranosidase [Lipingzhangella sp. LS1_29]|uniref:non-reducing end alpha-L-arabinofuranosidase n=1 Tax=Lipingzhangella rawalii TaxID=2055835 RepID=A0ABU2H494_9ACTN|nr:alpha-N-arabinofuranosidase [Lipingzhangella rawalii]MDS1269670.1 alpha-N-arabinofuranosidase [Lipingzhangella rawalii]